MIVNKYVLICREPLRCTHMENASFVNMEPILVPGDKINHTDFVGDQSKLFLTSGPLTPQAAAVDDPGATASRIGQHPGVQGLE